MSKRTHPTAKATPLLELLEKFDKKELATELGVSTATLNAWARNGEMSVLGRRACEGLLRRFKRRANGEQTLIIKCPQAQRETITTVLEGLGCKIFVVPFND